jgi:voltage-gated potassium channel Kch
VAPKPTAAQPQPTAVAPPSRWRVALKWLRIAVPIAMVIFFLFYRVFFTPDALFVLLFVVFLLYGLAFEFVKKFSPFLVLLLSYDGLRGFIPYVSKHIHYSTMINFDTFIGGGEIPTSRLQHLLYNGTLHWYDFYFYGLYMMHFVFPILFAVLIWRIRPQYYWRYVWSFVALSYAGFLTYLAFPAAPPWMASQNGYIPKITHLSTDIWFALGVHNFPTIYDKFSPNEVAAVPSLHAAYPTLVTLFIWELFGRKWGTLALIYPISVWVGVVYMGEHYVFDVTLGIIYAVVAFFGVKLLWRRWKQRHPRPRPQAAPKLIPHKQPA